MTATYREALPAAPLRRFIECYWFLSAPECARHEAQPILPDGCMELVFNIGDPFRRFHPDGTSGPQPRRMLVGQMDHQVTVRPEGRLDVLGVRFRPSGAHPLFRFPMSDLRNALIPLSQVADFPESLEGLRDDTVRGRKRALDAMLEPRFQKARADHAGFDQAVQSVVGAEGRVKVDDLSRDLGVSCRQLERMFRERVGLGPKRFAKVLRFQSVFRRAALEEAPWAALALDCGYYDQAHFIRDFRSFTGKSPGALFARENDLTRVFTRHARSGSYNTNR
jgi:AraC-like DNA-binding protein